MPTPDEHSGKKFFIDIEGTDFPWNSDTITVPEIRQLGGIPADVAVVEIDKDNNQRTLGEDETVEIKPGHGFSKKVRYGRG